MKTLFIFNNVDPHIYRLELLTYNVWDIDKTCSLIIAFILI